MAVLIILTKNKTVGRISVASYDMIICIHTQMSDGVPYPTYVYIYGLRVPQYCPECGDGK